MAMIFTEPFLEDKTGTLIVNTETKNIMKKIYLILSIVLLTGLSFAQNQQGRIVYEVEMSSDDPQMAMAAQMMNGSTLEILFDGENSQTKMDMGAMMSMTTTVNESDVLILMGGMMGQKAVKSTKEELLESNPSSDDVTVELVDETKEIAGYTCKKAILTDAEDNEIEYWYTEEFTFPMNGQSNANGKIPGVALSFSIDKSGMIMGYTATSIEDELADDVKFDVEIPEGYEEMTMEQMQSMGM